MSWVEDKSGNVTIDESEVKYTGITGGEQGNCMFYRTPGQTPGGTGISCHSWQFKVSGEDGIWLGVSSEDNFGPNYTMKGLFFGGPGNLSDGGSLVKSNWGPRFGNGDEVVMRLDQEGERAVIAYSLNGVGLGTAFDVHGYSGEFRPAVSMDKLGQAVTISLVDVDLNSFQVAEKEYGEGVEGDWVSDFRLSIEKVEEGNLRVCAKVDNSIVCTLSEKDGKFEVEGICSTSMMGPNMELEKRVTSMLENPEILRREGKDLVVTGAGEAFKFIRAPRSGAGPAGEDMINWMNI